MTYRKPTISENDFNAAIAAINLDEQSIELTRVLRDLQFDACEVNDEMKSVTNAEAILDNAVTMGLMKKRVITNYPKAIYHLADKARVA